MTTALRCPAIRTTPTAAYRGRLTVKSVYRPRARIVSAVAPPMRLRWLQSVIPSRLTSNVDVPHLMTLWKMETRLLSNAAKKAAHPAYRELVGIGREAVPFILNDLKQNGPADWFWALTEITGVNPITEEMAGNMKAMTEAWLVWGRTAGYLND